MPNNEPEGLDQLIGHATPVAAQNEPEGLDDLIGEQEAPDTSFADKAKTFGEGALSAATFGVGTLAERLAGVKRRDILRRREENPGSHMLGQMAGLALPSLLTGGAAAGAAGAMETAGATGAEALGLGGAEAGLASRIGAKAIKGAIEGAIFQGGDEVSKMMLSDPQQNIGTAAANIGLAGLLGGGIGGLTGAGGELWKAKFGNKVNSSLNTVKNIIEEEPLSPEMMKSLEGDRLQILKNAASEQSPMAKDVSAAFERLGAEPPTGTLLKDKTMRDLAELTSHNPTVTGTILRNERVATDDILRNHVEDLLKYRADIPDSQIKSRLVEGTRNKLNEIYEPISKSFDELDKELYKAPLSNEIKLNAVEKILKHPYVAEDADLANLANKLSDRILKLDTAGGAKQTYEFINDKMAPMYASPGGPGPEAQIWKAAKDAVKEIESGGLKAAEEAKLVPEGTYNKLLDTRKNYSDFKTLLGDFGVNAKLGKASSIKKVLGKALNVDDSKIIPKFFSLDNEAKNAFMEKNFPNQYTLAKRAIQRDLRINSLELGEGKQGKLSTSKFLTQVSPQNLDPMIAERLFPGKGQLLEDLQIAKSHIPGIASYSNTTPTGVLSHMFTPSGAWQNVSDAAKYALLKAQPHLDELAASAGGGKAAELAALATVGTDVASNPTAFKQMVSYIANTIKGETKIAKGAQAIFNAGKVALPTAVIDVKDREKLDKKLQELEANNTPLMDDQDQVGHYMPDHGVAIAQVKTNAVNYLNSLRPSKDKMSPLDGEPKVSKTAKAKYDRALDIALNPLIVFKDIKQGTVTQDDLKHLNTLYPGLYARMNEKINHQMIEAVHNGIQIPYKTKIGLSMFMGQPLDSTMSPLGIMSAQPHPAQQQQQMPQPKKMGMKSLNNYASAYQTPSQARAVSHLRH